MSEIWKGAFSPTLTKNYNNSRPAHGWQNFSVEYDARGRYVFLDIVFDHRDICYAGEDAPSNGTVYTYEVKLNDGEGFLEFRNEMQSKDWRGFLRTLMTRYTKPEDEVDITRIKLHQTPDEFYEEPEVSVDV